MLQRIHEVEKINNYRKFKVSFNGVGEEVQLNLMNKLDERELKRRMKYSRKNFLKSEILVKKLLSENTEYKSNLKI